MARAEPSSGLNGKQLTQLSSRSTAFSFPLLLLPMIPSLGRPLSLSLVPFATWRIPRRPLSPLHALFFKIQRHERPGRTIAVQGGGDEIMLSPISYTYTGTRLH